MNRETGFSSVKLLFWVALVGAVVWAGYLILPVYSTYWKVQDAFETVARNMSDFSEAKIRKRLPDLFKIKYIDHDDLPDEFYDNLGIRADGSTVSISSAYTVDVWLLGPPTESSADTMDERGNALREKAHLSFDFEPAAETP